MKKPIAKHQIFYLFIFFSTNGQIHLLQQLILVLNIQNIERKSMSLVFLNIVYLDEVLGNRILSEALRTVDRQI